MPDWRDWWYNSQAGNDITNLFNTIPNRLKRVLSPEDTTGQQIQYPTNRIDYEKLIKPEEFTQRQINTRPEGRQKDIYIGSSIKALTPKERMYSLLEDAVNKVKDNPAAKAAGMVRDAAEGYQKYLGSPLENVNPVHNAVGVMSAAQRMSGRAERLERLYQDIYNTLPPGGDSVSENMFNWGARGEQARLAHSHPRVMSELGKFERSTNPSDTAFYQDWNPVKDANGDLVDWTDKIEVRDSNRLREMYGQEPMSHGSITYRPEAWLEKISPKYDIRNPNEYISKWLESEGRRATGHEVTHFAQDLIANTPSRRRLTTGYLRRKYGEDLGYWLDPKEIGARARDFYATPDGKGMYGKSFLDAVIGEMNYTLSTRYKEDKWKQLLDEWAKDVLPEMEKWYGNKLMPVSNSGQLDQILKSRPKNSRILHGQPVSDRVADMVASVNPNNFRQTGRNAGKRFRFETNPREPEHLEALMKFIREGKRPVAVVNPRESDNFIGHFGQGGAINAFPVGAADPGMLGHEPLVGHGTGRFRYSDGVVNWTDPPSADEFFAVEDYLYGLGKPVKGHRDVFTGRTINPPRPPREEW